MTNRISDSTCIAVQIQIFAQDVSLAFSRVVTWIKKEIIGKLEAAVLETAKTVSEVVDRLFHSSQTKPAEEKSIDTALLSIGEQLEWRKRRFLERKPLPPITTDQRAAIEMRYLEGSTTVKAAIEQEIADSGIQLEPAQKDEIVDKVMKQYFLTKQYYSPAILQWMDVMLQHAAANNKKMVFLARDGIVLHDVAKVLIQNDTTGKYAPLSEEMVSLAWLSRKSAKEASERGDLLQRYFKQLGIEEGEDIILVDTGCTGSMKQMIEPYVKNKIEWQFSVSRNPAIHGFWDNSDFSLQALSFIILPQDHPEAWANDPKSANDWVEDTHRGNFISAEKLIDDQEKGLIYPSPSMELQGEQPVCKKKKTTTAQELSDALVCEYGYRAIVDLAKEVPVDALGVTYDETKQNLNDLLTRVQKGEFEAPRVKHD